MAAFAPILKRAQKRTGGQERLEAQLPSPRSAAELAAVPDDRYLSHMSRRISQAWGVGKAVPSGLSGRSAPGRSAQRSGVKSRRLSRRIGKRDRIAMAPCP